MDNLTCANLITMGRHIPTPFTITVSKDQGEEELRIDSILRVVPGKRLIGVSSWNDSTVIVKLFFQRNHWKRNLQNDLGGVNLLRQHHIPTPDILHQTTTADLGGAVLIIDYLQQGASLSALFEEATDREQREFIMQQAIKLIGQCHCGGISQKDIHLDNFMLADERVYLLDGGDIKAVEGSLDLETATSNLALFFAQFPVAKDVQISRWLEYYQEHGLKLPSGEIDRFGERVRLARRNRLRHFEKKLFRSTTATRCIRQSNKFLLYDRAIHSAELENFIANPDSYLASDGLLKAGNTSTVGEVRLGDREFVLKRYNIKGFWHGITRLMQPSRAHHTWRNSWMLEMLGIATPHPFLMLEERVLWLFRRRAYFLMEKVPAANLIDQLESGDATPGEVVESFKKLFQVLHAYLISHGDMKATNFIFSDQKLYVLDLDAMRRHKSQSRFDIASTRDLARFQRNWKGSEFETVFTKMSESAVSFPTG